MRTPRIAASLVAVALTTPTLALADKPADRTADKPADRPADKPADKARSREMFEKGAKAFEVGKINEALSLFNEAYSLFPHYSTNYNIGLCERALGHPTRAAAAFRAYLDGGGKGIAPTQRKNVEQLLREAEGQIATLTLTVNPDNARVTLDEVEAAAGTRPVDPGEHTLRAEAEGHQPETRRFKIATGEKLDLKLTLSKTQAAAPSPPPAAAAPPPPPPPPDDDRSLRAPFWVSASLATAALVSGAVTGSIALSDASAYNDPATPDDEADRRLSRGKTMRVVADVSFGVAIVSSALAVYFAINDKTSPREPRTGLFVAPQLSPQHAGLHTGVRF